MSGYHFIICLLILTFSLFSNGEVTATERRIGLSGESFDCPPDNSDSIGYQCAMGVYNNFMGLLQLPSNIAKLISAGQKNLTECNTNPEIKRGMLIVLEPMIDVGQWMSMSCEQIVQAQQLHEKNFLRQVVGKKNEQTRIEAMIKASSDPARLSILNQRMKHYELSEKEQNFLNRYMARESLIERLSGTDIVNRLSCVSYREILATTCEVIATAAVGGLAARAVRPVMSGIEKGASKLITNATRFRSVASSFQKSSLVDFYDGTGRVAKMTINPGDTFTVIIRDGRLILGKNIPGETGKLGGSGSHLTLMRLMGETNVYGYYGRGGAVRFNKDGSIDISGYHLEDDAHPRAFRDIEAIMKSINPDVSYESTPDRLSTILRFE